MAQIPVCGCRLTASLLQQTGTVVEARGPLTFWFWAVPMSWWFFSNIPRPKEIPNVFIDYLDSNNIKYL